LSTLANWSYTRTATHWAVSGRDDWTGVVTYAAPVTFDCDYKATAERRVDASGAEFITSQVIFTERDSISPGDMVLIGESTEVDPLAAGAQRVRTVDRYSDTFEQSADDYEVAT
jgi:hypothetical protein